MEPVKTNSTKSPKDVIFVMTVALTASANTEIESAAQGKAAVYDGSTTAVLAYLNMRTSADGDSGTAASTLTCSGTVTIVWTNLGDN